MSDEDLLHDPVEPRYDSRRLDVVGISPTLQASVYSDGEVWIDSAEENIAICLSAPAARLFYQIMSTWHKNKMLKQ